MRRFSAKTARDRISSIDPRFKELQDIGDLLNQPVHQGYLPRHHPAQSSFLRLPPEIRHEIYRYVVPKPVDGFRIYSDGDTTIKGFTFHRRDKNGTLPPDTYSLAVLRLNRSIYYEALSVLYSENRFHFIGHQLLPIYEFFRRLGPDAKAYVRQVQITILPYKKTLLLEENHDNICTKIHELCPGLNTLRDGTRCFL